MIRLLICQFGLDTILPNHLAFAAPEMSREIDWIEGVKRQKGLLFYCLLNGVRFIASRLANWAYWSLGVILSGLRLHSGHLVMHEAL